MAEGGAPELLHSVETGHADMVVCVGAGGWGRVWCWGQRWATFPGFPCFLEQHDSQMDYYGRRLATGSSDTTVRVYSVAGEAPVLEAELRGHSKPVWEVGWAHPKFGVLLASCGFDNRVVVQEESPPGHWSVVLDIGAAGSLVEFTSSVNSVRWAPHEHGCALACGSSDGQVVVCRRGAEGAWEAERVSESGDEARSGCLAVAWAPALHLGSTDARAGGVRVQRIAVATCAHTVLVYSSSASLGRWVCEAVLGRGPGLASLPSHPTAADHSPTAPGHEGWVRDVAWSPAIGEDENTLVSCGEDGAVIAWTQKASGGTESWMATPVHHFPSPVWRLSFSLTGALLAVSHGEKGVTLWRQTVEKRWEQVGDVKEPTPAPPPTLPHLEGTEHTHAHPHTHTHHPETAHTHAG